MNECDHDRDVVRAYTSYTGEGIVLTRCKHCLQEQRWTVMSNKNVEGIDDYKVRPSHLKVIK